jgi:Tn3 transposase DDE domain
LNCARPSERQLNKIEHAHRFTRAVSVGNPREFIQAEKQEQKIRLRLQTAHKKLHYMLESSLLVAKVG